MIVDLSLVQWWQAVTALIIALGLSPAPWLLGMARGRIVFTAVAQAAHDKLVAAIEKATEARVEAIEKAAEARVTDLIAQHVAIVAELKRHHESELAAEKRRADELEEQRDYYREARTLEAQAREAVTAELAESVKTGRAAVHALEALAQVAEEEKPT